MEIERKYLVKEIPDSAFSYPCTKILQAYLCRNPVIRVRKDVDSYYLTYKGKGLLKREEYNLPLNEEAFKLLYAKADFGSVEKTRYRIPYQNKGKEYLIELDVFEGKLSGLVLAECEFKTEKEANLFTPPDWFSEEVTMNPDYQNVNLALKEKTD